MYPLLTYLFSIGHCGHVREVSICKQLCIPWSAGGRVGVGEEEWGGEGRGGGRVNSDKGGIKVYCLMHSTHAPSKEGCFVKSGLWTMVSLAGKECQQVPPLIPLPTVPTLHVHTHVHTMTHVYLYNYVYVNLVHTYIHMYSMLCIYTHIQLTQAWRGSR